MSAAVQQDVLTLLETTVAPVCLGTPTTETPETAQVSV